MGCYRRPYSIYPNADGLPAVERVHGGGSTIAFISAKEVKKVALLPSVVQERREGTAPSHEIVIRDLNSVLFTVDGLQVNPGLYLRKMYGSLSHFLRELTQEVRHKRRAGNRSVESRVLLGHAKLIH